MFPFLAFLTTLINLAGLAICLCLGFYMGKLYISEGTFNRTRRRAVRGVAKALGTMEVRARQRG